VIRIRDPIHGSIVISPDELAVVDHRVYQRLRGVKQLGFTDMAFPGATHTRYAHGLGAMEVATRMFDALFPLERGHLPPETRARFRQMVRLALLLHDVGHPPASHASEAAMPKRRALGLDCFSDAEQDARASHEDYTILLLLKSALGDVLRRRFGEAGVQPEDVAHLVSGRFPSRAAGFVEGGVDYFPVLSQLVSGEMDADRMDYLQRDSFFAGVSYGKFDMSWLLENLGHHVEGDRALMALSHRAVFAFEDFLLSRYHMFVSVYYHYIPVGFDTMLVKFYNEAPEDFALPGDAEGYAATDDVALWSALRRSSNRWAQRIAQRQAFRRLIETNADAGAPDLGVIAARLDEAGVEHFVSTDRGVLSKYYGRGAADRPIYVHNRALKQVQPIDQYSRIYERYAQPTKLVRVYCRADQFSTARSVLEGVAPVS
jgi:HD superfamily phosphohydrolase